MSNSNNISKADIIKKYELKDVLSDKATQSFVEWLNGEDGVNKDCVQARRQAVEAYPALAYRIYHNKEIREAVEQKKSLTSALAEYYNVNEKTMRRIQGKSKSDIGATENYYYFKEILKLDEKHFQYLKDNLSDLRLLNDYGRFVYEFSLLNDFLDYLSLKGGNPSKYIKRMRENSAWDVVDAFRFLCKKLFYPALLNKVKDHAEKNDLTYISMMDISEDILKENTNINNILDFSERYHRNLFRWEDMFAFDSGLDHISWEPMFGEIDLGSGWMAREIDSVALLKKQGEKENHCVGGYTEYILRNDEESARLIFSLEKDGEIKSTIDILCLKNENGDKLDCELQQHRAHSNQDPSSEALNFSDLLIKKIMQEPGDKLDIYLNDLDDVIEKYDQYQAENEYLSECGYNPWDREILEKVWDEFKPALPAKLRRGGLDGLIDMMPIEGVIFESKENINLLNPWDMMEDKEVFEMEPMIYIRQ